MMLHNVTMLQFLYILSYIIIIIIIIIIMQVALILHGSVDFLLQCNIASDV